MAEFIDDEILEMAVAREVDANRFYLALAARVEDPSIKKIFYTGENVKIHQLLFQKFGIELISTSITKLLDDFPYKDFLSHLTTFYFLVVI